MIVLKNAEAVEPYWSVLPSELCYWPWGKLRQILCIPNREPALSIGFVMHCELNYKSSQWKTGSYSRFWGSGSPSEVATLLDSEDEGTMLLWNLVNYTSNNSASHPRRLLSSATPLWEPLILQHYLFGRCNSISWTWDWDVLPEQIFMKFNAELDSDITHT